jgi:hypothetical protein
MSTSISFDSNSLQTSSILTASIEHASLPAKEAQLYALAHGNKSTIPYVNYPNKSIRVSGKVIGSSVSNLDTLLDTFRGYFRGTDKNLDIGYGGSTRRYIATVNAISIDRPGGLQYANFDIEFICTEPFGRNTTAASALTATGRTAAAYTDDHTFLGTAPFQLPIITITITAVTGGTGFLKFANSGNGQGILITGQTFAADDIVIINCEEKSVTLNGEDIDFIGAFPEFPPGDQSFSYTDGFTTRTFDIDVDYYPLFF